MRKLINTCLLILMIVATPILPATHDFSYYEQRTCELLPILNINESEVTFIATDTEPTIQQRIANPRTIFLDTRVFRLPENAALFECAVAAQLAKVNWSTIPDLVNGVFTLQNVVIGLLLAALPAAGAIAFLRPGPSGRPFYEMSVALGIGALGSFFIPMFEHKQCKPERYYQEELLCRIDVLHALLNTRETAHVALGGLYLTGLYKDSVFDSAGPDLEFTKTIANKWEKLRLELQRWKELYPEEAARIFRQLDDELQDFRNKDTR